MELDKCPACQGKKELMQLGCLRGKCEHCDGLGRVAKTSAAKPRKKDVLNDSEQKA